MSKRVLLVVAGAATWAALTLSGATAFAAAPVGGNGADAPGQIKANENCDKNVDKQIANGQTGFLVGKGNDKKQSSVTNCDHVYPADGDVGPV
jgi:hypothetical protein